MQRQETIAQKTEIMEAQGRQNVILEAQKRDIVAEKEEIMIAQRN